MKLALERIGDVLPDEDEVEEESSRQNKCLFNEELYADIQNFQFPYCVNHKKCLVGLNYQQLTNSEEYKEFQTRPSFGYE